MINASKHKRNKKIPTSNEITCPACNKPRLVKLINDDGSIDMASEETVEVRGEARFLEVCDYCIIRYKKEDDKFMKENLHKLSKAFKTEELSDHQSDHKDFSLN